MTSGGRKVDVGVGGGSGHCPSTNSCAINDRASLLPVNSSTIDLVNVLYGVLAIVGILESLVRYLNVNLPNYIHLASTMRPPDFIHVIGVPGLPRFSCSSASMYYTKHKHKNGGGQGYPLPVAVNAP